ncbi:sugar ABC transporter substrate-binding protein [Subtercola lobariae]|uniref:Sugar ABC transporter substrate-binding protein n=1 Tax=Subtercola lobariae TaxID=1588641 RepID=A0A917B795_9MICO|nr:sugar ABC transporter substrate-binding protein [Subtercola lobariae]
MAASIALVSALALTGCGRADSTASTASAASVDNTPATGTVTLWAPDGDAAALDSVLAPFKAANPNVDVEVTLIPSDDYTTKLQSAVAAGTGPDIAQLYTESQSQFISGSSFLPVPSGLVDSSSFFPGSWQSGVINGTAYSVPWYAYTYDLVYRKDLAAQAGVSAPTTWDQTVPFFQALQTAGAAKGLGADVGWDIYNGQDLAQLLWQDGGSLMSSDGTKWTLNTPEMIKAIAFNASFFTSGAADTAGPGFLDAQPYFVSGKTASMITGPWVIGQFDGVQGTPGWTAANVATAPVPAGSAGSIGAVAGGSWGVLSTSKNADSSWKVIRYLSQPDTQVAQFKAYSSLPAVQAAWADPSIADQPLLSAFLTQLKTAKTYPQSSTWAQVATQLGAEMEAVAKGTETAEQAASNIQSYADGLGTGTK